MSCSPTISQWIQTMNWLKVAKSIKEKISLDVYEILCRIALSNYEAKADLMYRFLILGFHLYSKVMECLSNEIVNQIFRINKNVNNEVHHMLGFCSAFPSRKMVY